MTTVIRLSPNTGDSSLVSQWYKVMNQVGGDEHPRPKTGSCPLISKFDRWLIIKKLHIKPELEMVKEVQKAVSAFADGSSSSGEDDHAEED